MLSRASKILGVSIAFLLISALKVVGDQKLPKINFTNQVLRLIKAIENKNYDEIYLLDRANKIFLYHKLKEAPSFDHDIISTNQFVEFISDYDRAIKDYNVGSILGFGWDSGSFRHAKLDYLLRFKPKITIIGFKKFEEDEFSIDILVRQSEQAKSHRVYARFEFSNPPPEAPYSPFTNKERGYVKEIIVQFNFDKFGCFSGIVDYRHEKFWPETASASAQLADTNTTSKVVPGAAIGLKMLQVTFERSPEAKARDKGLSLISGRTVDKLEIESASLWVGGFRFDLGGQKSKFTYSDPWKKISKDNSGYLYDFLIKTDFAPTPLMEAKDIACKLIISDKNGVADTLTFVLPSIKAIQDNPHHFVSSPWFEDSQWQAFIKHGGQLERTGLKIVLASTNQFTSASSGP